MDISKFPIRLKELRKRDNISQLQLAEAVGVTRGSISFYEKGERQPDIVTLANIAEYFNVTTDYLLGFERSSSRNTEIVNIENETGLNGQTIDKLKNFVEISKNKTTDESFDIDTLNIHLLENENRSEIMNEFFNVLNFAFADTDPFSGLNDFFLTACESLNQQKRIVALKEKIKQLNRFEKENMCSLDDKTKEEIDEIYSLFHKITFFDLDYDEYWTSDPAGMSFLCCAYLNDVYKESREIKKVYDRKQSTLNRILVQTYRERVKEQAKKTKSKKPKSKKSKVGKNNGED